MNYTDADTIDLHTATATAQGTGYVGTFTLDRNPQNFFAEIEQAAFSPGNQVPGTGISPDKMLMARAFAYADARAPASSPCGRRASISTARWCAPSGAPF